MMRIREGEGYLLPRRYRVWGKLGSFFKGKVNWRATKNEDDDIEVDQLQFLGRKHPMPLHVETLAN